MAAGQGRGWGGGCAANFGSGQDREGREINLDSILYRENTGSSQPGAQGLFQSRSYGNVASGSIPRGRANFSRGIGRAALRIPRGKEVEVVSILNVTKDGVPATKRIIVADSFPVQLEGNYFEMVGPESFFQYDVRFEPEEKNSRLKREMLRQHAKNLNGYLYDGISLYTPNQLYGYNQKLMRLGCSTPTGLTTLTFNCICQYYPSDKTYLWLLNVIMRLMMEKRGLNLSGGDYFDSNEEVEMPAHELSIWPGYETMVHRHGNGLLLYVNLVHQVVREERCLAVIKALQRLQIGKKAITQQLTGCIVVVGYRNKIRSYVIHDINWKLTPKNTFNWKGKEVSIAEYYRIKFNLRIKNMDQPMLISRLEKHDVPTRKTMETLLLPEFVMMTGITPEMRKNQQLMNAINDQIILSPEQKAKKIRDFMYSLFCEQY